METYGVGNVSSAYRTTSKSVYDIERVWYFSDWNERQSHNIQSGPRMKPCFNFGMSRPINKLLINISSSVLQCSVIHVGLRWKLRDRRHIKNIDDTQTKHNQNKQTVQNTVKQNYLGSVASYDTRPGNEVCLFYKASDLPLEIFPRHGVLKLVALL